MKQQKITHKHTKHCVNTLQMCYTNEHKSPICVCECVFDQMINTQQFTLFFLFLYTQIHTQKATKTHTQQQHKHKQDQQYSNTQQHK